MGEKTEDHKLACAPSEQLETKDLSISNNDQDLQKVAHVVKDMKDVTPSESNATKSNEKHPHPQIMQFQGTPQNFTEQSSLTPKLFTPIQSSSSFVVSQYHIPNQQQNPTNQQVQSGQIPANIGQLTPHLWLSDRPAYLLPGLHTPIFQPIIPLGTTGISLQASVGGAEGGTTSVNQPQVPSICYPVGHAHTGSSGTCNPPSSLGHSQQSQPICYAFPGTYISSPPMLLHASSSTSPGPSSQSEIVRPQVQLSPKHQEVWDAQSAENAQLWNAIHHLQSELTEYKTRLLKIEAELSSQKLKVEESGLAAHVFDTVVGRQPSKRGRPRRGQLYGRFGGLTSHNEFHNQVRGGTGRGGGAATTPILKIQTENREHLFKKVILNKVEDKTTTKEQGEASNVAAIGIRNVGNSGSNTMISTSNNPVHEFPKFQVCGTEIKFSSEMKSNNEKATDSISFSSLLSQQTQELENKGSSCAYMVAASSANANLGWPANHTTEKRGRNVSDIGLRSNNSFIEGDRVIPGWNILNEEDGSAGIEDVIMGSTKDGNEEMVYDCSSGDEEIAGEKNELGCH